MTSRPDCDRIGTNAGHGHAWRRPDGQRMRCGGTGHCSECQADAALVEQCNGRAVLNEVDQTAQLFRFEDPFSGCVTRVENWPEGLVLWHGGVIVWRSWGPPAPRVPFPTMGGDV